MNRKLVRNIEKQKKLRAKKEEIEIELQVLEEEQIEMENMEVIKEFRSREISLDEFLDIVRKNKEEEKREKEEIKNLKEGRTLVENIENSEGEIIE
ncbi:MAG: hypothetical protein QP753_07605 [Peptoniphilus harei]|uniref:Uncharacterized protein n=2 Tax=Peptoniphilaceae TaxID=1570339 RepID=A0A379C4A3_9FIRM|nr:MULTISPECIES: hypothetical protein [Peptoniphilaceae]HAP5855328.1 hypothetical protein [Enterococcus faecalis]HBK5413346.1 hypothetical protein [Enterococcus faecium]MDK7722896.1 hypothetical protein [Peptoniphilus lacrimalis]MDK7732498.1 hypothetical protein [Peptoniphilus lacrimalis]MDK7755710.1 hypothetical protein [Peptoniphilus harei]